MEYCFQAKSKEGQLVRGTIEAASEHEVVLWLKDMSLAPLDICLKKRLSLRLKSYFGYFLSKTSFLSISFSDKAVFFRGLAFLLSSEVVLPQALDILCEQTTSKHMKRNVRLVLGGINSGASFSRAMSGFPEVFDPLCIAFARSGEESGRLSENMVTLASLLDAKERLRKKIISAMIYPALVMLVALTVLMIMSLVVLPRFEAAFSALNVSMPPITAFVFSAGRGAERFWSLLLTSLFFAYLTILFIRRNASAKLWLDGAALRLPVLGKIARHAVLSRSFAAMSCLLGTGVPLLSSIEIAGDVAANAKVRQALLKIREGVFAGIALNAMMKHSSVFPPAAVQMIRIGEETGKMGVMFGKLAENEESDLAEGVKRLTSVMEPLSVVLVGALVSFIALAIFMPVVTAIENFI